MSTESAGFPPDESGRRLAEALDVDPTASTPEDLHHALRRIIAVFGAEPDRAAHRVVNVVNVYVAEALEAKGREIARLREQVESVRADERKRIVAWLYEQAERADSVVAYRLADGIEAGAIPPTCEVDGDTRDTYDAEHYWHCDRPGVITVDGTLMCEDHAGEQGYGPKQEEYGFEPSEAGTVPAEDTEEKDSGDET